MHTLANSTNWSDSCVALTCRNQHHSHKESHLIWLQAQRAQLGTELKHGVQQGAHAQTPKGDQRVRLPIQESNCSILVIEQWAKPHHKHLQTDSKIRWRQKQIDPGEDHSQNTFAICRLMSLRVLTLWHYLHIAVFVLSDLTCRTLA